MRSLYWKICITFLIVVAASLFAGQSAFRWSVMRGPPPPLSGGPEEVAARTAALAVDALARECRTLAQAGKALASVLRSDRGGALVLVDAAGHPVAGSLDAEAAADLQRAIDSPDHRYSAADDWGPGPRVVAVPCQAGAERGWVVYARRPPGNDFRTVMLQSALAALTTVFVVASLLGLIAFRLLTRRLTEVQQCLAGVAEGELSLRVAAPGGDEIGDLGRSFNRMASRLQSVVGELEDNDRRRRQLLADISHELKTPLTVLKGQLEDVLDGRDDGGQRTQALVTVAAEEADLMALLIDDLLELARIDSSQFSLHRREVILQRVVQRTLARFTRTLNNRQVRLVRDLHPEPIRLQLDHRRIEQVIANLVQNALQSVSDGGWIEVSVRPEETGATLVISDDGRGIPDAELARVFERFRSGGGEGASTGLGLSIVKQLVEAHGGQIHLENRPGGGIRAIVRL